MEHEFSSLKIKHNIKSLQNNWRHKQKKNIEFLLRNLSEYNVFSGTILLEVALNNQNWTKKSFDHELLPGKELNRLYKLPVTPSYSGTMKLIFTIEGVFHLRGSEAVLDQNSATLNGKVVYKKEIKIK